MPKDKIKRLMSYPETGYFIPFDVDSEYFQSIGFILKSKLEQKPYPVYQLTDKAIEFINKLVEVPI